MTGYLCSRIGYFRRKSIVRYQSLPSSGDGFAFSETISYPLIVKQEAPFAYGIGLGAVFFGWQGELLLDLGN